MKRLITTINGTTELYAIQIREDGTRKVYNGYLLHNAADESGDNDRISGGIANVEEERIPEVINLCTWTQDFHIDGNGYYIFTDLED